MNDGSVPPPRPATPPPRPTSPPPRPAAPTPRRVPLPRPVPTSSPEHPLRPGGTVDIGELDRRRREIAAGRGYVDDGVFKTMPGWGKDLGRALLWVVGLEVLFAVIVFLTSRGMMPKNRHSYGVTGETVDPSGTGLLIAIMVAIFACALPYFLSEFSRPDKGFRFNGFPALMAIVGAAQVLLTVGASFFWSILVPAGQPVGPELAAQWGTGSNAMFLAGFMLMCLSWSTVGTFYMIRYIPGRQGVAGLGVFFASFGMAILGTIAGLTTLSSQFLPRALAMLLIGLLSYGLMIGLLAIGEWAFKLRTSGPTRLRTA